MNEEKELLAGDFFHIEGYILVIFLCQSKLERNLHGYCQPISFFNSDFSSYPELKPCPLRSQASSHLLQALCL